MVVTAVSEPQVLRVKREQPVHKAHAAVKVIKVCRVRREPQV